MICKYEIREVCPQKYISEDICNSCIHMFLQKTLDEMVNKCL